MSKKLYVLVMDGGDGSYYPHFTLEKEVIDCLQEAYDAGLLTYENGMGCDGDGFHYSTLNVPDDATHESLDISYPIDMEYANEFFEGR